MLSFLFCKSETLYALDLDRCTGIVMQYTSVGCAWVYSSTSLICFSTGHEFLCESNPPISGLDDASGKHNKHVPPSHIPITSKKYPHSILNDINWMSPEYCWSFHRMSNEYRKKTNEYLENVWCGSVGCHWDIAWEDSIWTSNGYQILGHWAVLRTLVVWRRVIFGYP